MEELEEVIEEEIENPETLDERADRAKESKEEAEKLIEEFMAFLHARVYRYSVHADEMQREEMHGTAMLAFYEAIQKYDSSKGHFLVFANMVVSGRLIDFYRRSRSRNVQTVSLDEEDENQEMAQTAAITEISVRLYEAEIRREQLVDEIEQFKAELDVWGLTFSSLVDQSPKHNKLREEYRKAIAQIVQSPDIIQTIQVKRYFPVKAIEKITGLPHKKLERARNFILASLIIKMGNYDILSDYVTDGRYTL